jgi:hypothetical protein
MKNDVDRVRFAVRFASESALPLRAPALNKLLRELAAFLGLTRKGVDPPGGFGVQIINVRPPYPWEYSRVQLFQLQRDARELLESAVEGRGRRSTTISDKQDLIADVVGRPGERTLRIGGSVRASFLLTLALLLAGKTAVPVLKCPEPKCGRLFVRMRRQKYCCRSCTNRAVWQAYPEKKKAEARRKQYEKYGWCLDARKGTRSNA